MMVCEIMASIELGVRASAGIRLIGYDEIITSEKTPRQTREAEHPASIPVSFKMRGEQCRLNVRADAKPFGVQRIVDEIEAESFSLFSVVWQARTAVHGHANDCRSNPEPI
jgi:hypothetical protein